MKKVINLKEVMIIILSVILITISTTSLASGLVIGGDNVTTITGNEYDNAQQIPDDNNTTINNIDNNTTNNVTNANRIINPSINLQIYFNHVVYGMFIYPKAKIKIILVGPTILNIP